MDELKLLAIQAARSILETEREIPGSQILQTLEAARDFLTSLESDVGPIVNRRADCQSAQTSTA
jgi:hypothetical protein